MTAALRFADVVLCASERQRLLLLGVLLALGRVNPDTYDGDPTLGRLVRVVPFGLPSEPPRRHGPGRRCAGPGSSTPTTSCSSGAAGCTSGSTRSCSWRASPVSRTPRSRRCSSAAATPPRGSP